jgi:hypothetical protein
MRKLQLKDFKDGWIIGDFDPAIVKTPEIEIGIIEHEKGEVRESHFHELCDEINVLLEGSMLLNGEVLEPNDIFIFTKKEISSTPIFITNVKILCIKRPSMPGDKVIV